MARPVIDARAASAAYQRAFAQLATFSGFDPKAVLRAESGSFLKAWAGQTKVATEASAERRARARVLYGITYKGRASPDSGYMTINSGLRGGQPGEMWKRTTRGKFQQAGMMDLKNGGYRWANIHFDNADWPQMVNAAHKVGDGLRLTVPKSARAVGLSRQSVLQIADALNIDLNSVAGGRLSSAGIAKARAALATSGRAYQNGTGFLSGDQVKAYAQMVNRLPYNTKIGMDLTAYRVLGQRARFIETAWKKGVFGSAQSVAKSFPNLVRVAA
jgi:hypothetical protein